MDNIFWTDDLTVLYKNFLLFFPTYQMTMNEQLNAITRFAIYLFILLVVLRSPVNYYVIPILIILFVLFLYYGPKDKLKIYLEKYQKQDTSKFTPLELESGYYDSNNDLHLGQFNSPDFCDKNTCGVNNGNIAIDPVQLNKYNKSICKNPTRDNPYMNPRTTDYNNGPLPTACNADDDVELNNKIAEQYNRDLFRDVDDLFNVKNSQRQFYTLPNTAIPNDQTGFANWCYKTRDTCKEDQTQCLRYSDIRFDRN